MPLNWFKVCFWGSQSNIQMLLIFFQFFSFPDIFNYAINSFLSMVNALTRSILWYNDKNL